MPKQTPDQSAPGVSSPKPPHLPHPFVKWVGGKRSLLRELLGSMPAEFDTYYEPFIGGGALFFALSSSLKNACISDTNKDLLSAYTVVKQDPEALIERLSGHFAKHSPEYYYRVRSQHHQASALEAAARVIYLNKTCYNGLYRVNNKGEFNVPVGRQATAPTVDARNIMACSQALQNTRITLGEYRSTTPQAGDFVYFDPPYHPTSGTSFTKYSRNDFSEENQIELSRFFRELHEAGVKLMLSNSNTPLIRSLYKDYNVRIVMAPRHVNSKGSQRNAVEEVLVTNYECASTT